MTVSEGRGGPLDCPMCNGQMGFNWSYDVAPEGEMRYAFPQESDYYREYHRCRTCGHFLGWLPFSIDRLYAADYVDSTYGGLDGIRRTFARIMALPPERSDNRQRVRWIHDALSRHGGAIPGEADKPRLLDVGFGLGVFPAAMQAEGWECDGIDLDDRQVEHAREYLGITAYQEDLTSIAGVGPFDLITFNKVLEHVEKPEELLAASARLLKPGGLVYVELPDGEGALSGGWGREEFFIEHIHVFSFASLVLLGDHAGFRSLECERVREPSSKYTFRDLLIVTEK